MTAPAGIKPGAPFNLTLVAGRSSEPSQEISVSWGYTSAVGGNEDYEIGQYATTQYLGPDKSNTKENIVIEAVAPRELANWKDPSVVLTVAVHQAVGKTAKSVVNGYIVEFNVADEVTEEQVVGKDGIGWKQDTTCQFHW
ncbi:uncharacterized protein B0T15DRAFT_493209 [Chaetomium strumarium]|uniref:Uncharacterized protein n=1 Tax=Chaetomium strumarium TaxID=1170767 RepID=A0AAJ0GRW5_9PEZI|nr:hypothetical protein B0T15DRAFT_493209 [Chaetomium strumarium]